MTTELLAMHGWASDRRVWEAFAAASRTRGWRWQAPDRGYGPCPARPSGWHRQSSRRLLIAHSLGPHLLPPEVLASADAIVLLASFGRFVPPGQPGRRLSAALSSMAKGLKGDGAESVLRAFLKEAASPQSSSQLPATILESPLSAHGRRRLLEDLALLANTEGLPQGLSSTSPVLIVEAERDRIVLPETRRLLREALPQAERIECAGIGHALLAPALVDQVIAWMEQR